MSVFRSTSDNVANTLDPSSFVHKPYLITNYFGSNIEEDLDMKNQSKVKNLPNLIDSYDIVTKHFVDEKV